MNVYYFYRIRNIDTMKRIIILPFLFFFALLNSKAQNVPPDFMNFLNAPWVNKQLDSLTLDEKIGQLFMIQAYSNKDAKHVEELLTQVATCKPGGVIFMQGSPIAQAQITNQLQAASKVPLLVAMDAEWGLGFRLDSTLKYPVQMALGAITNDSLIFRMGQEIGHQLRRIGVHMNMAPVCDVNVNPQNPVINYRSFGESPEAVARKSWLYASGMQHAGVMAVAKHFPGHGDTQTDSHADLPVLSQSAGRLDSVEMAPFRYLVNHGISSVMTGHLQVPEFESNSRLPASLSASVIQKKLLNDLEFKGLVISDAMNMAGVTKNFRPGEAAVLAIKAGNDMLEILPNLESAIKAVKEAVQSGEISEAEIDQKCRKVLAAKHWLGLDHDGPVQTQGLTLYLNNPVFEATKRQMQKESLTVLTNENDFLPLRRLDTLKLASLSLGAESLTDFQAMLSNYTAIDPFNIGKNAPASELEKIKKQLWKYNLIIVGIHNLGLNPPRNFGISETQIQMLRNLQDKKLVVVYFGNPYGLKYLPESKNAQSLVVTYQENTEAQELAAQLIFGAIDCNGKLPVSVENLFPAGTGISIKNIGRLAYALPEEKGIDSRFLIHKIDSLAQLGIRQKAFPGCQVVIAQNGAIILRKSYGYFTYDQKQPVTNETLYDWASITKITGPLPALMKLYDQGLIRLDDQFSTYWPAFRNTEKQQITFREILSHQSRLTPYAEFWTKTLQKNKQPIHTILREFPSEDFPLRVCSSLYVSKKYPDQIYDEIKNSKLLPAPTYEYTDLGFILFPKVIENLSGMNYEQFLKINFYDRLGVSSVGYNPLNRFPVSQIAPTELDDIFRKELLQGYVHDESAALLGGVSGNAGLFGTANDLAKIMQMYLQHGYYGGQQFISSETVNAFNRVQFPQNNNRRGLGFDKPGLQNKFVKPEKAYPTAEVSAESFGHSGFTGTFTWADPQTQTVFVFLSNRVYPTRKNTKLSDLNIRPAMLQSIYEAQEKGLPKY
jgi:beta-glucosidase-like glycosyl hydrolase/CubicO group peptidase (beta-lactamase class C family)